MKIIQNYTEISECSICDDKFLTEEKYTEKF